MKISAAYLCVIVIWSTTPLAIQWSVGDVGYLFGAVSRMTLGFIVVFGLVKLRGETLRFDAVALRTYLAAAIGIYGAMIFVYWGAEHIPSGWIAIVFGLSPVVTTVLSWLLLADRSLTVAKLGAQVIGLAGLGVVFHNGFAMGPSAALGLAAIFLSTCLHALSAVLIKRLDAPLPALHIVAGGVLVALVPYWATWWLLDGRLPDAIPGRTLGAIVYLGVFATAFGFSLYYYILKNLRATQVALITFIAPIAALALGRLFNDETVDGRIVIGAALVLLSLLLHEVVPALRRSRTPGMRGAHTAALVRQAETRA